MGLAMSDLVKLETAIDKIKDAIKAEFPDFDVQASEDVGRGKLKTPSILLQLTELEPNPEADCENGQFPCFVHVEASVILGANIAKVRRETLKASGALAAFVHDNRLGVPWGTAKLIAVEPDEFSPNATEASIWRLEWVHEANVGPAYDFDSGVTPSIVLTSWSPDIGSENEGAYSQEQV